MPKSKRDKKVSLTAVRKKTGLERKQQLVEKIHQAVDEYARVFVFSVQNMRNVWLQEIREKWKHSRFFFGMNKLMQVALGKTAESEYKDNLHKISDMLFGEMGLLCTNSTKKEVLEFFDEFRRPDFARSGNTATQAVIIEEGPLPQFPHSMEPQLRKLGLPTTLQRGVVTIYKEHKVCSKGSTLTPEQAHILKLFGHRMCDFHMSIHGMWSNDGTFESLKNRPIQEPLQPTQVKLKSEEASGKEIDDDELGIEEEGEPTEMEAEGDSDEEESDEDEDV